MSINKNITIAGKSKNPITVNRMGYGTMRLTGPHIWGEPARRDEALQILKEAVESDVQFFDTADYYGNDVTNRLIAEALFPYPNDIVICTKVGGARKPDASWVMHNSPENLRSSIEKNLETLFLDQITLVHFRVMNPKLDAFKESMEAMYKIQQEGKILHVGVSNVKPEHLKIAMEMGTVATVENMYSHAQRTTGNTAMGVSNGGEEVLSICEENEIPLIPYFSLMTAEAKKDPRIAELAKKYNATEAQINLAWLLHRSPWILPIPGTSSLGHFKENIKAQEIKLSEEDMDYLK